MNWVSGPGWNMQQSNGYFITKHAIADKPGSFFYVAYWGKHILSGSCESAEAARAVCAEHNGKRS